MQGDLLEEIRPLALQAPGAHREEPSGRAAVCERSGWGGANAAIAYGLEGNTISIADAVKAYLQSELASLAIAWVRLPKEVWPAHWHGLYKGPLI